MKNLFFIAALIFSAFTLSTAAQSSEPSPEPIENGSVVESAADPDAAGTVSSARTDERSQVPAVAVTQTKTNYTRPDSKTRFKRYISGIAGPTSLARQVAGAGYGTWSNSPEEWGGQWEGFGKRLASGFGKNVIKQTTIYGLDSAMKLDSHYYRSEKRDVGSKIRNAVISPVTARNSRGKRVVGVPRLVGTYTAAVVAAETWYPDRYDWKDGVRSGTISLGMTVAFNLFKEFVWKK